MLIIFCSVLIIQATATRSTTEKTDHVEESECIAAEKGRAED